jgi:hypothetical protein
MKARIGFSGWIVAGAAALILSAQVTARQIEHVDRMERDDGRYPTTVEGSARLIDSY